MARRAKGDEFEAFSRGYRKLLVWGRGEIAAIKREARRRERREGRREVRRGGD